MIACCGTPVNIVLYLPLWYNILMRNPTTAASHRRWRLLRSEKRKQAGLCIYCGVEPCRPGLRGGKLCLESKRESTAYWRHKNPERWRIIARRRKLKSKYGLSLEDYEDLFTAQGGKCAICSYGGSKPLCVDHDHSTGKVRGLLCGLCNSMLGRFDDRKDILQKAQDYLTRSQ